MRKTIGVIISFILILSACRTTENDANDIKIQLSDDIITVNGNAISNDASSDVYSANDIICYLAGNGFTYGEGTEEDEHEQSEADEHTVVHITKPGKYILSGSLSKGQIAVDLGENSKDDENAVVTLVFNGVDITCTVAPAVIFYNVYECGNKNEKNADKVVDTTKAGANVIIAEGTTNNVNGSYVAKIYEPESVELNESETKVEDADKLHKYDGAFYSKMSMNISGGKSNTGILNINAKNEGIGSEMHLTINGGIININSGNDGINTNEDNVSVTTVNGGTLNIRCEGSTGEGDGIDSNGWLVINGGTVISQACATSGDSGIDSDKGIYINGGKVVATGNMFDRIAGGDQNFAVFKFSERQNGNATYKLINSNGNVIGEYLTNNAFTYLIIAGDELAEGDYTFWQNKLQLSGSKVNADQGGMPNGERPQRPNGIAPQKPPVETPAPPNGERPEPPNGSEGDFNAAVSKTFTITKGENQFTNVSPSD